jgi:hypothetical protein
VSGIAAVDYGRLLSAVQYEEKVKMPPAGKPPASVLSDLERWVKLGAPLPSATPGVKAQVFSEAKRKHWAFQPAKSYAPPVVKNAAWVHSRVGALGTGAAVDGRRNRAGVRGDLRSAGEALADGDCRLEESD